MSDTARAPRLMERVRSAIRARHCSKQTEDAYAAWIRRQELLGHSDVRTTMIYTHVLQEMRGRGMRSPLDRLEEVGRGAE